MGLARCAHRQDGAFLPGMDGTLQRDCSEQTAQEIDHEVKRILEQSYAEAQEILERHREHLDLVARTLLQNETLDAQAFNQLIGRSPQADEERPGNPVTVDPPSLASGNGEQSRTE